MNNNQPVKKMNIGKLLWFAYFLVATYSLSRVFETSRALFQGQNLWIEFSIWFSVLVITMFTLAYQSYQKEKQQGSLRRPVALFDWIEARFNSNHSNRQSVYPHSKGGSIS